MVNRYNKGTTNFSYMQIFSNIFSTNVQILLFFLANLAFLTMLTTITNKNGRERVNVPPWKTKRVQL